MMAPMKPGTRVRILMLVGPKFERDWSQTGRVCRVMSYMKPLPEGYQPVRYDSDGAVLLIHSSNLMTCNAE